MAYLLRTDGVNDHVVLPSTITGNAGTDAYSFEFKAAFTGAGNRYLLAVASGTRANGLFVDTSGRLILYADGGLRYQSAAGYVLFDSTLRVYRLEHDTGGAWRMYRDNELISSGAFTASVSFNPLGIFFRQGSTGNSYLQCDIAYFQCTGLSGGQYWQSTLSGGAGSNWPTVSGTNQGTLVNFPTNNSQWIYYDDGGASNEQTHSTGGTATAIASAIAVTVAVNAQSQSTSGQVTAIANTVATTTATNGQARSTAGTTQAIGTAQAVTVSANEHRQTTSGSTQSLAQLIAQSQIVNAQAISTGGITTAIGYVVATTSVVNETGNAQQVSSGGSVIAVAAAVAVTSIAHGQQQQTSGTASATASATAETVSVHEQRHTADGTIEAIGYAVAVTTWFDGTEQSLVNTVFIKTSSKTIQSIKTAGKTMHHLRTDSRRAYQIKTSSEG